jgi:hypothetical protein
MPTDVAPLCPTCLERAPAWTAASCPACKKSSPVGACDHCLKSRAGANLPDDAKGAAEQGDARFLCVDCMERLLDQDVSDRMRDSILAVGVTVVAVFLTAAHSAFVYALFAACAACFLFWWIAVNRRTAPARQARKVWSLFRRRVEAALKKRERTLR